MRLGCVVLALVLFPAAALAQEEPMTVERQLTLAEEGNISTVISFSARVTGLRGDAFSETADSDVEWSDLFKPGLGLGAEISRMWENEGWYGFYASFGFSNFEGDKFTNSLGDTLEPDRLTMANLIVGARGRGELFGLFNWDMRLGMGLALFNKVDATTVISAIETKDEKLFKRSGNFMTEGSLRLGFGPLSVGGGAGYVAPPEAGSSFDISPKWLITYFGEVAFTVNF